MPSARVPTGSLASFVGAAVAALLATGMMSQPAEAAERSYRATDVLGRVALFRTVGVRPRQLVRALIRVGSFERRVNPRGVRRGLRRGVLRVHIPRSAARRLAARKRIRRASMPRLRIRYEVRTPSPPAEVGGIVSGFETGDFSEFVGASAWTGDVAVTADRAYEGEHSAKGIFTGGASGAMRTWYSVDWRPGTEAWYGLALLVADASDYCYWNPLRWDNYKTYGGSGDVGGLTIERGRLSLMSSRYGDSERELVDGARLPEGRWVWLEVHQRFAGTEGEAL